MVFPKLTFYRDVQKAHPPPKMGDNIKYYGWQLPENEDLLMPKYSTLQSSNCVFKHNSWGGNFVIFLHA